VWPEDEFERMAGMIRESGANLIWVGLGCPKQERWIAENKDRLPPGVYFGIGAAFAFHAGEVSQAPAWIQRMGMEWLYRLLAEPRRLWRRYFTYNSLFVWHSVRDALRGGPPVGSEK
jgi:N-acetylglucosaminyldiphosphoundecaprenol N-acetyl-beta-D-mannosaminyltransferase